MLTPHNPVKSKFGNLEFCKGCRNYFFRLVNGKCPHCKNYVKGKDKK